MLFAILFIQIMAFFHFSQSDRILNMNMNLNNIGKLKISGYRGQHDEAVITIVNESRDILFSLPSADVFENWSDYVGFAQELIDGWNKNH
jgi:hypothetical protein